MKYTVINFHSYVEFATYKPQDVEKPIKANYFDKGILKIVRFIQDTYDLDNPYKIYYCADGIQINSKCFISESMEKIVKYNRYSSTGKPHTVTNYYNWQGEPHNENGPAYLIQDLDGNIKKEEYILFGITLTEKEWQDKISAKLYW